LTNRQLPRNNQVGLTSATSSIMTIFMFSTLSILF